jgi:Uma2 family endonuclease
MINLLENDSMCTEEFIGSKFYHDGGWELMRGELVAMSPSRVTHEFVSSRLMYLFQLLIDRKKMRCRVGGSNAAVLYGNDSFVMPDLLVSCDRSRIDANERFKNAPEIVVEVLSKSTRDYDMSSKLELYRDAGACEYWMVDMDKREVVINDFLNDARRVFNEEDMIVSEFFGAECFSVTDVFEILYDT